MSESKKLMSPPRQGRRVGFLRPIHRGSASIVLLLILGALLLLPGQQDTVRSEQPATVPPPGSSVVYLPLAVLPSQADNLQITATPDSLVANGRSEAAIIVAVRDSVGVPIAAADVQLSTDQGLFANDAASISLTTGADGIASTVWQAPVLLGTSQEVNLSAQVRNLSGSLVEGTTTISLNPATISSISLFTSRSSMPAVADERATLVAELLDAEGWPLPVADYPVRFFTTWGLFPNGSSSTIQVETDSSGAAIVDLFASAILRTAEINAQAAGATSNVVNIEFILGQCNDEEPNNVPNEAKNQPPAVCVASMQEDPVQEDDYYTFFLDNNQTVSLELTDMQHQSDYDLILYDSNILIDENTQAVANSSNNSNIDERIDYLNQGPAGTFFVRIYMYSKSPDGDNTYRLRIAKTPQDVPGQGVPQATITDTQAGENDPPLPPRETPPEDVDAR
jgi:hypothetical protein